MVGSTVPGGGGSVEFSPYVLGWEPHAWQGVEASPCTWLVESLRDGGGSEQFSDF